MGFVCCLLPWKCIGLHRSCIDKIIGNCSSRPVALFFNLVHWFKKKLVAKVNVAFKQMLSKYVGSLNTDIKDSFEKVNTIMFFFFLNKYMT